MSCATTRFQDEASSIDMSGIIHIISESDTKESRPRTCSICNKPISRAMDMARQKKKRRQIEAITRQAKCSMCNKTLSRARDMARHMKKCRGMDDAKTSGHDCVNCGKTFSRVDNMKRHLTKCTSNKRLTSNKSRKTFTQIQSLKRPTRVSLNLINTGPT